MSRSLRHSYQFDPRIRATLAISLALIIATIFGCERKVEDSANQPIIVAKSNSIPESPARIVSLAPNVTETLFAVGAGKQVVGVTRFCDYPPEVASIPKIGGVIDPDFEAILGLKPDLVIGVTSAGDQKLAKALDTAKVPYLFLKMESLDETFQGIEVIGKTVGQPQKGKAIASEMREAVTTFEASHANKKSKPKVLLVFGRKPIIAAGPNTFANDLLEKAGGTNIATGDQYPKLDIEKVMELNPDRIIDLSMSEEGLDKFWDEYPDLKAVKSHNVYRFDDPAMMRPGPRLIQAFQKIAMAIKGKHSHDH